MNLPEPIGGYFELESRAGGFLHSDGTLLNSGRNCFAYILKAERARHVYLPKFTCDVMLEPLKSLGISYDFYTINDRLEIAEKPTLLEGELIVYTNYFGLKDAYAKSLADRYSRSLILDYSQAFYVSPAPGSHTFYSPRKFFGVTDGGIVYTDSKIPDELATDVSYERFSHLIKRIDLGPEAAYEDFKQNDQALSGEPIKKMSNLTRSMLGNIDYEADKRRRLANYHYLSSRLDSKNQVQFLADDVDCPMYYPFISTEAGLRERLIAAKIFVPLYWPNVLEWAGENEIEHQLAANIIPLPIDQRYDEGDMARIIEEIGG